MALPSLFPIVELGTAKPQIVDGLVVKACVFCRHAIEHRPECTKHYSAIASQPEGYYQCPFGFTTRSFNYAGQMLAFSGLIAFPRFDTFQEREKAKRFPDVKVTREALEGVRQFLKELETVRADTVQRGAEVLPQAFHELRKLNGALLQHSE